jgi:hypothetical protein
MLRASKITTEVLRPVVRKRYYLCFEFFKCLFFLSSNTHFVTRIIPKSGKIAINKYGKIATYIEGSNILI